MQLLDRLLARERQLWTNNAPLYRDALVEDAVLIFPETDVISRDASVEAIRQDIPGSVHLRGGPRLTRRSRTRPS